MYCASYSELARLSQGSTRVLGHVPPTPPPPPTTPRAAYMHRRQHVCPSALEVFKPLKFEYWLTTIMVLQFLRAIY